MKYKYLIQMLAFFTVILSQSNLYSEYEWKEFGQWKWLEIADGASYYSSNEMVIDKAIPSLDFSAEFPDLERIAMTTPRPLL